MIKLSLKALTFTTALAIVVGPCWAQDPPKPDEAPKEQEEQAVAPKWNWIEVGYGSFGPSGNRHKFQQYSLHPNGPILRDFQFLHGATETQPYFWKINASGSFNEIGFLNGQAIAANGRLNAKFHADDIAFYDPSPIPMPKSRRKHEGASVSYLVSHNTQVFAQVSDKRRVYEFEPPKDARNDRTREMALGFGTAVAGGNASVAYTNHRYYDRTFAQPHSERSALASTFDYSWSDKGWLRASGLWSTIEQDGMRDSKFRQFGVAAGFGIGEGTSLRVAASQEDITLPDVENAYVRQRFDTSARLNHQFSNGSLQVGYRHREAERLRNDHSFVDVPKWDRVDGRISYRLNEQDRFTAKVWWEGLSKAATVVGLDGRSLFWDDRVRAQVRYERGSENFSGYAAYDFRYDQNAERNAEVFGHHIALGGSWNLPNGISCYAELANEFFTAKGVIDETNISLDDYFPSVISLAAGASWALDPKSTFSASINAYTTHNDNPLLVRDGNVRGIQLAASYLRQFSDSQSIEVSLAPWSYRDKVDPTMDYKSTSILVTFRTKF